MSSQALSVMDPDWTDPQIAIARQAGLDAIKPTASQIQHGLELHAQATVIDNYGFSVQCPVDPVRWNEASQRNAWPNAQSRVGMDSTLTRMAEDPHQRACFEQGWRAAGVTCVLRNAGEEGNVVDRMIERLACHTYVTDKLKGFMTRATTAQDIKDAKANNQHCFIFTNNGVPMTGRLDYLGEELRFIRIFRQFGVRMMHLTYNRRNLLADGCAETNDGGLSDMGRHAIAEMNRQGVIVDVAHSSIQSGFDAIACSSKPVMISHATCLALNKHCRGKPDELLKAIAANHGVMGIAAIPAFLGGDGTLAALLDHVDHAVKVMGADHVAIGSDVGAMTPASPGDQDHARNPTTNTCKRFESYWPKDDPLFDPAWNTPAMVQSLAWTNWPLFTVGLVQRGHSDEAILKILGGNALRVLASADD